MSGEWGINDMRARIAGLEAGSGSTLSRIAELAVSGHRAVAANVIGQVSHVGKSDVAANRVLGITTGAALAGASVTVQVSGEMTEAGWNWTAGPIWLGEDGLLTQSLPSDGLLVRLGTATAPTKIIVSPQVILKY